MMRMSRKVTVAVSQHRPKVSLLKLLTTLKLKLKPSDVRPPKPANFGNHNLWVRGVIRLHQKVLKSPTRRLKLRTKASFHAIYFFIFYILFSKNKRRAF